MAKCMLMPKECKNTKNMQTECKGVVHMHLTLKHTRTEHARSQDVRLMMCFVITVSRSTWNDKNQCNGVATNLFCLGVIGHRKVYLSIKIKIN